LPYSVVKEHDRALPECPIIDWVNSGYTVLMDVIAVEESGDERRWPYSVAGLGGDRGDRADKADRADNICRRF
jgi:hypothetical protein